MLKKCIPVFFSIQKVTTAFYLPAQKRHASFAFIPIPQPSKHCNREKRCAVVAVPHHNRIRAGANFTKCNLNAAFMIAHRLQICWLPKYIQLHAHGLQRQRRQCCIAHAHAHSDIVVVKTSFRRAYEYGN